MKSIHAFLLTLTLSLSVFGQASKQVLSVGTIADLHARRPQTNEVVSVRHGSTSNLWSAPRVFVHDPASVLTADGVHVLTNAAASGRYVSQDRESAMQNVAWWGAVGNGTTDDTAALQAAAAAITTGKTLFAPAGKTFLTTNSITLTNSRVRVDFSGSTIKFTGTTRRSALQLGPTVSVVSGMDFAISTSTNYVTGVPSSTFATGDMVMLYNSVESPANYNPGQLAFVTAASGTTMTLDRFPDTGLQITNAYRFVSAPEGIEIRNVVVDLSGATDGIGISAVGRGHLIENCRVVGTGSTNDPNYIGIELRGQSITARNNFVQGILDAGNAVDRSGYGIFLAGDNIVAENNELADCKHCISSSERKAISRELRIVNNRIRQRDDWARLTDVNGAYLFTAALDVHANVRHATIKGNDIKIGGRYALSLRNGNFDVIGNTVEVTEQAGLPFAQQGNGIAEAFITRAIFAGNQFKTPDGVLTFYFDRADSGVSGTHSNLTFLANTFEGGLLSFDDNGTGITNAFAGVTMTGNLFRRAAGTPVLLTGAMRDTSFIGNRFEYGSGGNGISLALPGDDSDNNPREILITGNVFTRLDGAGYDVRVLSGPTNIVELGHNRHGPAPVAGFNGRVAVSQTPPASYDFQLIEADADELFFNSPTGTNPGRLKWGGTGAVLGNDTEFVSVRSAMTDRAFAAYHTDTNGLPFVDQYNFVIKSDGLMSWSDGDNAAQIVLGPRRNADVTNGVIRLSGGLGLSERTEPIQPSSTTATIWLEEADTSKSIKVKWPDGTSTALYPQSGGTGNADTNAANAWSQPQTFLGGIDASGGTNDLGVVHATALELDTPLDPTLGGTGGTNPVTARAALGLAYDVDVLSFYLSLKQIAQAMLADGDMPYRNAAGIITNVTSTAAGRALLAAADAEAQRQLMSVGELSQDAYGPGRNGETNKYPSWDAIYDLINGLVIGSNVITSVEPPLLLTNGILSLNTNGLGGGGGGGGGGSGVTWLANEGPSEYVGLNTSTNWPVATFTISSNDVPTAIGKFVFGYAAGVLSNASGSTISTYYNVDVNGTRVFRDLYQPSTSSSRGKLYAGNFLLVKESTNTASFIQLGSSHSSLNPEIGYAGDAGTSGQSFSLVATNIAVDWSSNVTLTIKWESSTTTLGSPTNAMAGFTKLAASLLKYNEDGVFSGDGSGLTNLNASNLASGTVPTNRLDSDLADLAAAGSTGGNAFVRADSPTVTGTWHFDSFTANSLSVISNLYAVTVAYGAGWNGSSNVPTRDAVYDEMELRAPKASPALTGDPTAPTASANDNDTSIATTAYVQAEETAMRAANYWQATNSVLTTAANLTGGTSTNFLAGDGTFKQVTTNMVPGLVGDMAAKATLASPALTGTPTVNGTNLMAAIASAGGGGGGLTLIDGTAKTNVNFRSSYYSKASVSSVTNVDWIPQPVSSASTASFTPAFNSSRSHEFTLTNTATLNAPSGVTTDMVGDTFRLVFIQDSTGNRTLSAATNYLFGSDITGLTLTTNAGARDYAVVYVRRTNAFDVIGFVRGYAQ